MEAEPQPPPLERPKSQGAALLLRVGLAFMVCGAAAVVATWPLATDLKRSLPDTNSATIRPFEALNGRFDSARGQRPESIGESSPDSRDLAPFRVALDRLIGLAIDDHILRYNLGFLALFVWAGLGTYALALHVLGDHASAILSGLAVLMSGALRFHAQGSPELLGIGWVPVTLVVWLMLFEKPAAGRVILAAITGVAVCLTAGTIALLSLPPVLILTGAEAVRFCLRSGRTPPRRRALLWSGLILAPMLLYINIFMVDHSLRENGLRVPLWSYVIPVSGHRLAGFLPFNAYWEAGIWDHVLDIYSYLGLLTILLIHRSWTRRAEMRRPGFFWGVFGLMVLVSLGDHVWLGRVEVPLPARWLWTWSPILRRCGPPAWFHLDAVLFAAVIAGSGARHFLNGWSRRGTRLAAAAGLCLLMVLDLALLPFPTVRAPARFGGDRPAASLELAESGSDSAIPNSPPLGRRERR